MYIYYAEQEESLIMSESSPEERGILKYISKVKRVYIYSSRIGVGA